MFNKLPSLKNEKGFTLIELLIVIAIIGILAAIAIPQFSAYKERAYDADSRANLHNIYLSCKAYWGDNTSTDDCSVNTAKEASYGYNQSTNIDISMSGTAETSFAANASHSGSSNSFDINSAGNIT